MLHYQMVYKGLLNNGRIFSQKNKEKQAET